MDQDQDRNGRPGARAEYHSCLFTAISLDAEWTRRSHIDGQSPDSAIDKACESILKRCTQYKAKLERNRIKQGLPAPAAGPDKTRWDSLYSPLEYVPMGHDDALSLVVFDDFAPLISITSRCPTTVEEVSLGYIPKLESLVQGWLPESEHALWIDRARASFGEPEVVFKKGQPLPSLMVMSRFKVNGIGSLGMGSLHHVALMRAMVRCIGETLLQMDSTAASTGPGHDLMEAFEIGVKDLEGMSFMMVDLLGQEELGIVYFVSNWSIASALNSRLQSLRFDEVLAADASGCLKEELLRTDWMEQLCGFYSDTNRATIPPLAIGGNNATLKESLLEKIQHAHPLRWVRSTPGVRKDLFSTLGTSAQGTAHPSVRGWIDATTHLRLAPGHQTNTQETIQEVKHQRPAAIASIQVPGHTESSPTFTIHQLGASDLALPHHDLTAYNPSRLVPVRDFLAQVHDLMGAAGGACGGVEHSGRDIVGMTSFCGIPVPVLRAPGEEFLFSPGYDTARHVAVLEMILPILKHRLIHGPAPTREMREEEEDFQRVQGEWEDSLRKTAVPNGRGPGNTWGSLSASNIGDQARLCGLPQPLVRTLEFVYHNFTTLLANPFAFDSVLDLYDIFAAFHRALTQELPKLCRKDGLLDIDKVDMIARLIDAVHRALGHRMYRLFPENANRDMDIDFRGGLNALVYSADGILKLGVGVLRHHVLENAVDDRARVGVVTRIGFRQGIFAQALRLDVESETRLGIVETDVPHLYHLPSYVDFLHEAFHLVYDAARNPGTEDKVSPMLPTIPRGSDDIRLDARLAEIFANMLTALFVCADEPRALAEHMALQYSIRNIREKDTQAIGNFIELACLLFIVCRSLEHLRASRAEQTAPAPWWFCADEDEEEKLSRAFAPHIVAAKFWEFFESLLPFFSPHLHSNLASLPALREQVEILCDELYNRRLKAFVPIVAAKVCLIFSRYWFRASGRLINAEEFKDSGLQHGQRPSEDQLTTHTAAWDKVIVELRRELSVILNKKQPLYTPFSFLAWRCPQHPGGRLDPMILLGVLLGETLRSRSVDMAFAGGPHHLPTNSGAPTFEKFPVAPDPNERPRLFIQRGVSALFTSDFEHRAHRLGSRITLLKMFGDMASLLRSKRFSEMLQRNLSVPVSK